MMNLCTITFVCLLHVSYGNLFGSQQEDTSSQYWDLLFHQYSSNDTLDRRQLVQLLGDLQSCKGIEDADNLQICVPRNSSEAHGCHIKTRCAGDDVILVDKTSPSTLLLYKEDLEPLCPVLLYQSLEKRSENEVTHEAIATSSKTQVWGYGILFVTLISCCSLLGVSVLPLMGRKFYDHLLTTLIGLAVGSLAGSSCFHLIPQAFSLGASEHGTHDYLIISLMIMFGIYLFFMVERLLKILSDVKTRRKRSANRLAGTDLLDVDSAEIKCELSFSSTPEAEAEDSLKQMNGLCVEPNAGMIYKSQEQVIKASFGNTKEPESHAHEHEVDYVPGKDSAVAAVAWMIIFGDGLHNFIDGLSIGAGFNQSILTGISISLAVLCEELPHELGDFAVLLHAGMSMRRALTYNFLSACTCYIGLGVGIQLGELTGASAYIFGMAGGMFLYISLADMMPEMNELVIQASKKSCRSALFMLALQNLGMFLGVGALFALAYYQEEISLE